MRTLVATVTLCSALGALSCAGPSGPASYTSRGSASPSWVNGLREPLQELPAAEWAPIATDSGIRTRGRTGEPEALGNRLSPQEAPSTPTAPIRGGDDGARVRSGDDAARPSSVEAQRASSALERHYRGDLPPRPDRSLEQFGYREIERLGARGVTASGPAAADHVIVEGDELIVDLTTDETQRIRAVVEADGSIELPGLLSVRIAGERFDDARKMIRDEIARIRRNFELHVGLGRLASVPIRVVGEALAPGVVEAGPRPTLLDAIGAAGVRKTGSLRRIRLDRSDGASQSIDLYSYLLGEGPAPDIRLSRGDTLTIPPIGRTIGVAGSVQRPGIYELTPDGAAPNIADAIRLAGGGTGFALVDSLQIERTTGGRRALLDVDPDDGTFSLDNGDLLLVGAVDGRLHPVLQVEGEVTRPGRFQYRSGMTVGDLVRLAGGLTVDAFEGQAILSRRVGQASSVESAWDAAAAGSPRRILVIDLRRALAGHQGHDIELEPLDHLRVHRFEEALPVPTVEVIGASRRPGTYELTAGMSVSDLIAVSGNLTPDAFREEAELVRRQRTADDGLLDVVRYRIPLSEVLTEGSPGPQLMNGDRLIIRRLTRAEVRVVASGRVRFPGEYVLPAGARITDLIAAAGGLLDDADLRAAKFTRASLKSSQLVKWEELAERTRQVYERNLERRVNSARSKEAFSARIQLEQVRETLERLRESQATGRIVLPFSRDDFPNSAANLTLEPGDALSVPRRVSTVTVQGHVFNPLTVVLDDDSSADDLIERAGGLTEVADQGRIYVVRADGQVASVAQRGGRFRLDQPLLPGDIVLVPPRPLSRDAGSVMLDVLLLARTAGEAGALWNLATSALDEASLSIIDTPASPRSDSTPPAELLREFQR